MAGIRTLATIAFDGRRGQLQCPVKTIGVPFDEACNCLGSLFTEIAEGRLDNVEYATLEWVDWFNNRRLFGPIGDVPPIEFEEAYYRQRDVQVERW